MVFDPTQSDRRRVGEGDPAFGLRGMARSDAGRALACRLGARSGSGGLEDAEFWYTAAEKLLAPLLFAGAKQRRRDGEGHLAG